MRVSAKPLSRINIRRYAQYVRHQLDLDNEFILSYRSSDRVIGK